MNFLGMNFVSAPAYLEELGVSAERLEDNYFHYWLMESTGVKSMTELARRAAARVELGRMRLGFITLMAQTVPQTPVEGPHGRSTKRAQFEVSSDILAIASDVASSQSDELQIARTYWRLGEFAYERYYLPDISTEFLTKAAQIYVRMRRWQEVAVLYSNLGISEAGAGYIGSAIGWLDLSAEVYRSLDDEPHASLTISLAGAVRREPAKFFAPSLQMRALLSSGAATSPEGIVTEVYGLGVVAIKAIVPSLVEGLRMAVSLGDTLLDFVNQEWPTAAIAASAVDVRIISRILAQPELLDNLEARAFEVLVATLFEGFGAEVELTKETRDGGYDVEAKFEVGDVRFRVLIEAKKWRRERKVGIDIVDRLMGVRHRLKADKVILVTTSTFSSVARKAAAKMYTEIELVDRGGLTQWIENYLLPSGGVKRLPALRVNGGKVYAEQQSTDNTEEGA